MKSSFPQSKLEFVHALPHPNQLCRSGQAVSDGILLYDSSLPRHLGVQKFKKWSQSFAIQYPLKAGEDLKTIQSFARHAEQLSKLISAKHISAQAMTVVVMGGGSVGDFGGFFASVFRRGVDLVHLPSTWLAAIDSAHGGKTALNLLDFKNQIGTFYPARRVFLVRQVLLSQPLIRAKDALGELLKIAIIDGRPWIKPLRSLKFQSSQGRLANLLWQMLPNAIEAKLKIVKLDPSEQTGIRSILNLGHTWGHVIESQKGISHGESVLHGLVFSLNFSLHRGFLTLDHYGSIRTWLETASGVSFTSPPKAIQLTRRQAKDALAVDKKGAFVKAPSQLKIPSGVRGAHDLRFIFVRKLGRPHIASVSIDEILNEAAEQGWLRE